LNLPRRALERRWRSGRIDCARAAAPMLAFGLLNCGVFVTLKTSLRRLRWIRAQSGSA
jgi:hypothetical protein